MTDCGATVNPTNTTTAASAPDPEMRVVLVKFLDLDASAFPMAIASLHFSPMIAWRLDDGTRIHCDDGRVRI